MDIIVIVMMLVIGAVAAAMEGDFSGVKVIGIVVGYIAVMILFFKFIIATNIIGLILTLILVIGILIYGILAAAGKV